MQNILDDSQNLIELLKKAGMSQSVQKFSGISHAKEINIALVVHDLKYVLRNLDPTSERLTQYLTYFKAFIESEMPKTVFDN